MTPKQHDAILTCAEYVLQRAVSDEALEAANAAIEFLKSDGWIKCSERMPEKDGPYQVSDGSAVFSAHFTAHYVYLGESDGWSNGFNLADSGLSTAKFWQPLPQPPKE